MLDLGRIGFLRGAQALGQRLAFALGLIALPSRLLLIVERPG